VFDGILESWLKLDGRHGKTRKHPNEAEADAVQEKTSYEKGED
jgi:hypothetical protein